jgi:hypothetical protein
MERLVRETRVDRGDRTGMRRAARSCRDANSNMGPCGPFPSLLHRHRPATPGRAHRRAGRPLDRPAPGHAGPPPRPSTPPRRRRRPHQRLVLCDRVLATLIVLRLQLPHQALAVLLGVDRATITRAIGQIRPLLAARGFAVPGQPTLRLRTLADVVAYAAANGVELPIDGTQTQVRRPRAHRPGRRAFISGKRKQNTLKPTVISDGQGRTLWAGAVRPGRMHDQTAVKTQGIADLLTQHPGVKVRVDEATGGWPARLPSRSQPHPASPPRTPPPSWWLPTGRPGPSSPPGGSAWSTRPLSTSTGGRCSAGSAPGVFRRDLPGGRGAWSRTGLLDADRATAGSVSPTRPTPYRAPSRYSHPRADRCPRPEAKALRARGPHQGLGNAKIVRLVPPTALPRSWVTSSSRGVHRARRRSTRTFRHFAEALHLVSVRPCLPPTPPPCSMGSGSRHPRPRPSWPSRPPSMHTP